KKVPVMAQQRRAGPPPPRQYNPAVTPAVEAIVLKCLAPHPGDRYRSAADLKEDIARQLNHQPLLHVREPSHRERLRKWCRRHPRMTSSSSVGLIAATLLFLMSVAAWTLYGKLALYDA